MGNVTISTSETTIFYPSDWLVTGSGATWTSMGCPKEMLDETNMFSLLSIMFDIDLGKWQVFAGGTDCDQGEVFILMESSNYKDVATYFTDYMIKTAEWWQAAQAAFGDNK